MDNPIADFQLKEAIQESGNSHGNFVGQTIDMNRIVH